MSKVFHALAIVALVAGCGSRPSGNPNAPKFLDDACGILDERRNFLPAFRKTQDRYGVPVAVIMSMIWQESKFKAEARTPNQYKLGVIPVGRQSSAYGYAQALDATWEEYQKLTGNRRAKRDNINDAAEFMGWYMQQSNKELGLAMNDTRNQYLAYHDGRSGFRRGTYKSKPWLVTIANKLEDRAIMYHLQLEKCGKL
ncbi:MAG: transglycosylase SLT domain-containing protein [Planktomarina sp.]